MLGLSCCITVHYEIQPTTSDSTVLYSFVSFAHRTHTLINFYFSLSRSLSLFSFAERYGELFCFSFNPNLDKELREKSWAFIDLKAEFIRMGIPRNLWHATAANHEYRVSMSSDACSSSGSRNIITFYTKFQRSVFEFNALNYIAKNNINAMCGFFSVYHVYEYRTKG